MTPAPDTSRAIAEARASAWEGVAKSLRTPAHKSVPFGRNAARNLDEASRLLLALLARCEAAEAALVAEKEESLTYLQRVLADVALKGAGADITAYARGFREGAEKMREAAVGCCAWDGPVPIRAAIRALPLPEPQA